MKIFIVFVIFLLYLTNSFAQDAAATGISRAFNPAISVNCLFDYMNSDNSDPLWSEIGLTPGMHYQAVDIEMTSNVDVYLQAKIVIGTEEDEGLYVEEAYLSTLRMPIPVILRGGKMLNTFGRHNLYHLHHMAFAEPPMILQQVFGPNLNEVGLEASYLLPLPWYGDAIAGIINGSNRYLFNSNKQENLAYLGHLDNLLDIGDEITVRLGGSYLTGARGLYYADEQQTAIGADTSKITSKVWGFDFQMKWKPLQRGRYRSFTIQGEYVNTSLKINDKSTDPLHGYFIQALGQFNLYWWLQARYDWFNRPNALHPFFPEPVNLVYESNSDFEGKRYSFAIGYVPTEFSAYRLQYNIINLGGQKEQQIVAQVNVTIGSHPAHKY